MNHPKQLNLDVKLDETIKLENRSIENLIDKTYQELVIRLAENIITK